MNSEARLTRSAMRTRSARGLTEELQELPAKTTPARGRPGRVQKDGMVSIPKRLPFDELSNVQEISNVSTPVEHPYLSPVAEKTCTPAVATPALAELSDIERLLLSPMPSLTPKTVSKTALEEQTAAEDAQARAAAALLAAEARAGATEAAAGAKAAGDHTAATEAKYCDAAEAEAKAEADQAAKTAAVETVAQANRAANAAAETLATEEQPMADAEEAAGTQVKAQPAEVLNKEDNDRWETEHDTEFVKQDVSASVPSGAAVLKSKVVVSKHFEPRSIRQLKKEIKAAYAQQAAAATTDAANDNNDCSKSDDEDEPSSAAKAAAASLSDALDSLNINSGATSMYGPLRGIPVAQGKHLRFTDQGEALEASPKKVQLRGLAPAAGKHIRFDD